MFSYDERSLKFITGGEHNDGNDGPLRANNAGLEGASGGPQGGCSPRGSPHSAGRGPQFGRIHGLAKATDWPQNCTKIQAKVSHPSTWPPPRGPGASRRGNELQATIRVD